MDKWANPTIAETIPQFVHAMATAYGNAPAVVHGDAVLEYDVLERESALIARSLLAADVGKGSRVGLLLGNGPAWVTWWAAVSRIGAVAIPLSTFYKGSELRRVLRHADI